MSKKNTEETQGFYFRTNVNGTISPELTNLSRKVQRYFEVLENTEKYRLVWEKTLKAEIKATLKNLAEATGLKAEIVLHDKIRNLEAIQFSLGISKSGMAEEVDKDLHRPLIKHNGSLVYQQLFNGKITVIINYPVIEGYGQPVPPRQIGIYRPEELQSPFFVRHMEEFVNELTNWEDYDDDHQESANQQAIGFKLNFQEAEGI